MKSLRQLFERNSTGAVLIKYAFMTALVDFGKSSFSYDFPVLMDLDLFRRELMYFSYL